MKGQRHRWGKPLRFIHKTERLCEHCGMIKVTRHEVEGPREHHWQEFWVDLDQIICEGTPPCRPRCEVAA